jgi:hypothetical protein
MKPNQTKGGNPVHQTVAEKIQFESAGQSIEIEFTDQQLSPHAGTATFWSFVHESGWREVVARCLPHPALTSNNALSAVTKVLGFVQGLLYGAKKLTHCAYLRRDPMMPALLGIKRVPSQSTFTRFFQGFTGAGKNLACFRPLFAWGMQKLPAKNEGYALDFDSTRLLHEDGHQEGVEVGYTRVGTKPCLHPLLAIFSEARLVGGFWLRPGNCSCANNVVGFFLDLWDNLPSHVRLRVVRADSGFYVAELLHLWEQLGVKFIVVARLTQPVRSLLRRETCWLPTGLDGTAVAELEYDAPDLPATARFVAIRHRLKDKRSRAGGKLLFDCPGYLYQVLVTNQPRTVPLVDIWRDDNGRAACENVIKELDAGYGLPDLVCKDFWATEAALSFGVLAHNLIVLFEQKLGWQEAVTLGTLRYWLFVTAGIISRPQGQTTIKLAVPMHERDWWRGLWDKLLSPNPNCNAVGTRPAFA